MVKKTMNVSSFKIWLDIWWYYLPKFSMKESVKLEHLGGQETPKTKKRSGQLLLATRVLFEYTNYVSPFSDIEESIYFEPL